MSRTAGPWRAHLLDGVPHGFFGAAQGSATSDDDATREGAQRCAALIAPAARVAWVRQVHGRDVVKVRSDWDADATPREADAMVSATPGIALAIRTADCTPVLLADGEAGVIGAAHAGWRGAIAGVTDATVEAMCDLGAARERIVAAIGPTIARASYEVDAPLFEAFVREHPPSEAFFTDAAVTGRWYFDLPAWVAMRLSLAGVRRVEDLGRDTFTDPALHSYRRDGARAGRNWSVVAI